MADRNAGSPSLLFVLSNDYGELANALYLLAGQEFRAVLLMPDRLFSVNRTVPSAATHRYGSGPEVMDHVRRERPDIVLLFSGYLYAINNILTLDAVEALVGALGQDGYPIVTSDPFLGVLSALDGSTFSDRHPRKPWLLDHFGRLARLFREIPHLYLVSAADVARTPSVSFFNERIVLAPGARAEHGRTVAGRLAVDPSRPRWLFVLSQEDYEGQAGALGRARFEGMLIDRLRQTAGEGRQPVLIAPAAAMADLQRSASIPSLVAVPFCDHGLFTALLFDAEYVFYWNVFSNSIPARVLNHLPVFFFDRGHLAHAIPALWKVGRARYYAGSEPRLLDREAPLDAAELAGLARAQDQDLQAAREAFRQSPSPRDMLAEIQRRRPGPR